MKKYKLILALALSGAVMLSACGHKGEAKNTNKDVATEEDANKTENKEDIKKDIKNYLNEINAITAKDCGSIKDLKYKDLTLQLVGDELTDIYYNNAVKDFVLSQNLKQEVDRPIKNGDYANIDYVGTIDGKEFEGGKSEGYDLLIGSHSFVDNFEDQLVGHKKGDEVVVKVKFPENYTDELKGKDAEFKVKINNVSEPVTDSEFSEKVVKLIDPQADYNTYIDDFKKRTEEDLKLEAQKVNYQYAFYSALEENQFDLNDATKTKIAEIYEKLDEVQLKTYGISKEDYLKYIGETEEDYNKQLNSLSENIMKTKIFTSAVLKDEKAKIKDEDYKEFAKMANMTEADIKEHKKDEDFKDTVKQFVASKYILENAKKDYKTVDSKYDIYSDLDKLMEKIRE